MGKLIQFDAYYATSRSEAARIISQNCIPCSETGRFGSGIYLFDKYLSAALTDANMRMVKSNISIINARIVVDSDYMLDLVDPFSEDAEMYACARVDLEDNLEREILDIVVQQHGIDPLITNALCHRYKYQLIRAPSYVFRNVSFYQSKVPSSVDLCVKDSSIVQGINEVQLEDSV